MITIMTRWLDAADILTLSTDASSTQASTVPRGCITMVPQENTIIKSLIKTLQTFLLNHTFVFT